MLVGISWKCVDVQCTLLRSTKGLGKCDHNSEVTVLLGLTYVSSICTDYISHYNVFSTRPDLSLSCLVHYTQSLSILFRHLSIFFAVSLSFVFPLSCFQRLLWWGGCISSSIHGVSPVICLSSLMGILIITHHVLGDKLNKHEKTKHVNKFNETMKQIFQHF